MLELCFFAGSAKKLFDTNHQDGTAVYKIDVSSRESSFASYQSEWILFFLFSTLYS